MQDSREPATIRQIPATIWVLGFVSMLMDISSEMIHSLLPVFLVSVIGASMTSVGIIEGIAEATALIVRVFSGALSDFFRRRKPLLLLGYGLAAITKPIFPLTTSLYWVMSARFIDRIGKGIRGAPRDALIADISPPHLLGKSYGLRQTLDTVGAFIGPLIAIILMIVLSDNLRLIFWIATIPAAIAVTVLFFSVKEPEHKHEPHKTNIPVHGGEVKQLSVAYWQIVVVNALLMLAQFSEAFLILRAQNLGMSLTLIPLVLVAMNIAYAISAYPAGFISDLLSRRSLIAVGIIILIMADILLANVANIWQVMLGVILWGFYMGFTRGVFAAWVAETAPQQLRGTAFGIFSFVSGIALLLASMYAGWIWDQFGPHVSFYTSAGFALLALFTLLIVRIPPLILSSK